jgi:phage tail fiber protein|nr:MAG TPA: putative tail fiber protein [Caudoviricetes sp.]
MANVTEEVRWENGIYQIETTDPVVGGVDGISNKQAKQLANRTSYLKKQVEDNKSGADLALATKRDVVDSYSKIEIDEKFAPIANSVNKKLDKTDQAADAAKLGGMMASVSEISNTIAQRTAEGDLRARYLRCGHVELQAPTQDNLMGTTSELIFRNISDKYERGTTLTRVLQCLNSIQSDVAWMDSDIITPDNKNQVGFARLPGGLIIQFGITNRLEATGSRKQIFPIAFPHACFVVLCSPHLPQPDNGVLSAYTSDWNTKSCTVKNLDTDSTCHIIWVAIGN